jgi:hypothetical protein
MPAAATVVHGSADDDNAAIRPRFPFLRGRSNGGDEPGFIPGYAPLFGPHFRIGYQGYFGIQPYDTVHAAESDSTIGLPTLIRPPLIPRRNATPAGVRDAIIFVQSQPNSWPVIQPNTVRR